MSNIIIKAENLGKKYTIRHQQERYSTFRDVITQRIKSFGKKSITMGSKEEFWALKNVSFDIKHGDRIGIIGKNGAGKSTLLKVLSRVTVPTTGNVILKGRVASLLEVGTGFHPELTGRENIYLNGAILGMSKTEIRKKFDDIVEFAEIEKFLDTPVKRYSSGMYVRLAFSVAAHLDPEVLIIDEVLAVGDAQFQKKCLEKMQMVGQRGGTLLVVSHQMSLIQQLCDKSILLEKGELKLFDHTQNVLGKYISQGAEGVAKIISESDPAYNAGSPYFRLTSVRLADKEGNNIQEVMDSSVDNILFVVEGTIDKASNLLNIGFILYDVMNTPLMFSYHTDQPPERWPHLEPGPFCLKADIDISMLSEGRYRIELISTIHCEKMLHDMHNSVSLEFEIVGNRGNSPYWISKRNALLAPFIPWSLKGEK